MRSLYRTAAEYFEGRNFMTPEIIKSGFKGPFAYELSSGQGMSRQPIYGVSLRNRQTGDIEEGKLFQSIEQANDFIRSLEW